MTEPRMIQPVGFHFRLSGDWTITAVTINLGDFLPTPARDVLGKPITSLLSEDAIHDVRNRMALLRGDEAIEHLFHVPLVSGGKPFDLSIYRDGDGFGIDAEPSDAHSLGDSTGIVEGMLARVEAGRDVETLCGEAAKQLRALTGFDRCVIHGDGKLLGKSDRAGAEQSGAALLARFIDNLVIADSQAVPVAIVTQGDDWCPSKKSPLRLPTADEASALSAIGARAALIVPITRDGRAWGFMACTHGTNRHIDVERRSVVKLFARIIALRIEIVELRSAR